MTPTARRATAHGITSNRPASRATREHRAILVPPPGICPPETASTSVRPVETRTGWRRSVRRRRRDGRGRGRPRSDCPVCDGDAPRSRRPRRTPRIGTAARGLAVDAPRRPRGRHHEPDFGDDRRGPFNVPPAQRCSTPNRRGRHFASPGRPRRAPVVARGERGSLSTTPQRSKVEAEDRAGVQGRRRPVGTVTWAIAACDRPTGSVTAHTGSWPRCFT